MLESSGKFVRCVEQYGGSHSEDAVLFGLREQSPVALLAPEQCPQTEDRAVPLQPLCALLVPGKGQRGTWQTQLTAPASGLGLILSEGFLSPRKCNRPLWKLSGTLKQDCYSVFTNCACNCGT